MYQNDPKRVLTPECRLSYCNLVTARAPQNGVGDPKFSVTLLIPKSNPTIKQELDAAMNAAAEVDVYPPQKAPAAPAVSSRSLFACTWRRLSPEASPIKR